MNTSSLTQPTSLSRRFNELTIYFLRNDADLGKLQDHFKLSAAEVIEFITSPHVRQVLADMASSIRSAMECIALQATQAAIAHLESVCTALAAAPDQVKQLRLASTTLGRLGTHLAPKAGSAPRGLPAEASALLKSRPITANLDADWAATTTDPLLPDPLPPLRGSPRADVSALLSADGSAARAHLVRKQ